MSKSRRKSNRGKGIVVTVAPPPTQPATAGSTNELTGDAVNTSFKRDAAVRAALASNLQARGERAREMTERARLAFRTFDPHPVKEADQSRRYWVPPGGDVLAAVTQIIQDDTDAVRSSETRRSLKLRRTGNTTPMIDPAVGPGVVGRIALDALRRYLDERLATHAYAREIYTACEAEVEANRRMAQIENDGEIGEPPGPTNGGTHPPAGEGQEAEVLVKAQVDVQMSTTTSPESKLAYNVERRANPAQTDGSIQTFELRDGASDVTAVHDFSSLQIAFNHVWMRIFDGRLRELGELLYAEFVRLQSFTRDDPRYPPIDTIEDLKNLLSEIRQLALEADEAVPESAGEAIHTMFTDERHGINIPIYSNGTSVNTGTGAVVSQPDKGRLFTLLESLEKILATRYAFDVFATNSINFGILVTYRQTWTPLKYQVGELVSTIPLAPKEVRRYTTRFVTKKTRSEKELEDSLRTQRTDMSDTKRVDAEIVERAQNKNSFNLGAKESFGQKDTYNIESTQTFGGESSTDSSRTKKEFREHVMKSAYEYREQHRTEIDTSLSTESEETTFHEIQNPNDELTVTYLFYELQRQYEISEKIYKLTPVILVANEVPRPDAITDAWLMQHDWILRRVILDDSFRPALDYLTRSFVGAELNIRILQNNAATQKQVVEKLNQQIQAQTRILAAAEQAVVNAITVAEATQVGKGALDTVKRIFDPIGITGETSNAPVEAAETTVDYAKEALDNAMKEKARLLQELNVATSALQAAVDKLSSAVKEHYNNVTAIDRLRVHVKDNILYYMQAIWSHEPPDQRFFRTYKINVPDVQANTAGMVLDVHEAADDRDGFTVEGGLTTSIPMPSVTSTIRKLVEVADLDTLLGFKGNYMIFPLKRNNFITLFMMQDYLELADEIFVRDPDRFGDYGIDDLQRLATCLRKHDSDVYQANRTRIRQAIIDRLTSGRKDKELVVVPTKSLFIEALVGTHPLLEDFKLIHRALDVKKVQAEVRHAELENVRLAARALKGKDEDPDIEKKIVIEGGVQSVIPGD